MFIFRLHLDIWELISQIFLYIKLDGFFYIMLETVRYILKLLGHIL